MGKIPTSVLVLSIIGIAMSVLGCLGLAWGMVVLFVDFGVPNPARDMILNDPVQTTYSVASAIIGVILQILLLSASIGSLFLKKWAQKGMLLYAWTSIVLGLLGLIYSLAYMMPRMMAAIPAGGDPATRSATIGAMIGGMCGSVVGLAFPICILYFYRLPRVTDAFNGVAPPSSRFPVDAPSQFP